LKKATWARLGDLPKPGSVNFNPVARAAFLKQGLAAPIAHRDPRALGESTTTPMKVA
jgi:hypothetical protein